MNKYTLDQILGYVGLVLPLTVTFIMLSIILIDKMDSSSDTTKKDLEMSTTIKDSIIAENDRIQISGQWEGIDINKPNNQTILDTTGITIFPFTKTNQYGDLVTGYYSINRYGETLHTVIVSHTPATVKDTFSSWGNW